MHRTEIHAPWRWSMALLAGGFALLVACEVMSGVGAFQTANRTVLFLGAPVDALGKVATASLAGFAAFGGAIITGYLLTHDRVTLRRQGAIALAATSVALAFAIWNQAQYFGWARRMAEYPIVRQSAEYAQAVATHRRVSETIAAGGLGYEEADVLAVQQQRAAATIARGERPTGSEIPGPIDWLKATVAYVLIELMGAGFRLPIERQKRASRGARRKAQPNKRGLRMAVNND